MKNKHAVLRVLFLLAAFPFAMAAQVFNPFANHFYGVSYPVISATTKAGIIAQSPDGEEILWEHQVIQSAHQNSPFADNMTGGMGSGKPIIIKNALSQAAGTSIVISTVDVMGSPGVQGNGTRVGSEEQLKPGDFKLFQNLWWCGLGIDNTAQSQTIIGREWDDISKRLLAVRLAKKQSDDAMVNLVASATSLNTLFPNGKTLDTLSSSDTFQTSLVISAGSNLKDNGAIPMNARKVEETMGSVPPPPIQHYMMFLSDAGARPIKTEPAYVTALAYAKDRGNDNNLFTGEYSMYDGHLIYSWQNIRHGAYASIGSAVQPEALLGTAIVAKATTSSIPGGLSTSTAGGLDGGGSNAAAAATPAVNFFEFFSLFAYLPTNGITLTVGTGTRYFAVIDKAAGKVSFFSYTGNSGHQLTGLTRLGSTIAGDYNTTVGSVTWDSGAYLVAADGNGYLGVSEGVIAVGSQIVETNAKGVPLCRGFGLGEMALVCGYGSVPTEKGLKPMANRTYYQAPHGQARANGIEIAYGTAAFQRPDGNTPNYCLYTFARQVPGMPQVA